MTELILNNDRYCGVESVLPLFIDDIKEQPLKKGDATIKLLHFKSDPLFNARAVMDGGWIFRVREGHYTQLFIGDELMMSDTGMERLSNFLFIQKTHGRVLIAGLGIGLIIHNILKKQDVTEIIVIEKYQEVIDLVAPKFTDPRLKFICADIFDFKPAKGEKFNVIYFDIWTDIDTGNLKSITILHNRFKYFLNREDPQCYMNSWMKEYLQNKNRQERSWRW